MFRAANFAFLLVSFAAWIVATPLAEEELPALPDFRPISELPDNIPTCDAKDINLNECLKRALQQMTPRLKDGIPELNIPPMDPMIVERNSFQIDSGLVKGRVQLRNFRVFGISEGTVEKIDFRLDNGRVHLDLLSTLPRLYVEGNYKADVKINDLQMTPKGYFNVSMSDLVLKSQPQGELYERDGHMYLRVTKFDFDPEIGDMRVFASNLVPDPSLNAVILDFVNQYWRQIYKTMLPETRNIWEPLLLRAMNAFLASVPFDLFITL